RVGIGDGGEFLHYMLFGDGKWHQITRISDQTSISAFGPGNSLFLLSRKDAPMGKILELTPPSFSLATAKPVVTRGRSAIDGFLPAGGHLFVQYMAGGPSKLLDKEGAKPERNVELPAISSVGELVRARDNQLLFENESFTEPPAWYRYDSAS